MSERATNHAQTEEDVRALLPHLAAYDRWTCRDRDPDARSAAIQRALPAGGQFMSTLAVELQVVLGQMLQSDGIFRSGHVSPGLPVSAI